MFKKKEARELKKIKIAHTERFVHTPEQHQTSAYLPCCCIHDNTVSWEVGMTTTGSEKRQAGGWWWGWWWGVYCWKRRQEKNGKKERRTEKDGEKLR